MLPANQYMDAKWCKPRHSAGEVLRFRLSFWNFGICWFLVFLVHSLELQQSGECGPSLKWHKWHKWHKWQTLTAYVQHMPLGIPWVLDSSRTGPMAVSSGRRLGSKKSRVTLARFICYHVLSCPLRRHIVIHCISSCMLLWHGMHFYETCASKSIARESFAPETSMWLVLSWRAWTWGREELLQNWLLDPDPQREVIDPILHPISRF